MDQAAKMVGKKRGIIALALNSFSLHLSIERLLLVVNSLIATQKARWFSYKSASNIIKFGLILKESSKW